MITAAGEAENEGRDVPQNIEVPLQELIGARERCKSRSRDRQPFRETARSD
jgi:hypothetical protein